MYTPPPGEKNVLIRKEINSALLPILSVKSMGIVACGDLNDVVDVNLDTSSQMFRKPSNSTLKFLQTTGGLTETFRYKFPHSGQAFSRFEGKIKDGEFKVSASRLDHVLVCKEIISKDLLLGVGIDNKQDFIISDHSPIYITLDLSSMDFSQIEIYKAERPYEPNWRKINEAVSQKLKLQSRDKEVPQQISEIVDTFVEEMGKEQGVFVEALKAMHTHLQGYDSSGIATLEMREALDSHVARMHKSCVQAAARSEKRLSKGKGKPLNILMHREY